MADWMDWLEGISGGGRGIVEGLTLGTKPFDAWEKVRTQDLANDKSDIQLRDLGLMQSALENPALDYYGGAAQFKDSGNRLGTGKNERDLFGVEQNLALNQYLASPGFQEIVARLDPSDPEYRQKVAAAIAQYDPTGGIASYDKFGIPAMEQRNLNLQAVGSYLESYAQRKDPNAVLVWNEDGTASIIGSDGTVTPIPPDLLIRAASMMAQKDPYSAVSTGVKDQIAVEGANIKAYDTLNKTRVTPQQMQALVQERLIYTNEYNKAVGEVNAIKKDPGYAMLSEPEKMERLREPAQRALAARKELERVARIQSQVAVGAQPGAAPMPMPQGRVAPQGGSSVTAPRRSLDDVIGQATGVLGALPGGGQDRPAYPPRRASPWDTGIRSITGDQQSGDSQLLMQQLQSIFGVQ